MITRNTYRKTTTLNLKEKVLKILKNKGYSHLYNEFDFNYYKKRTSKEFSQAFAIANLFIKDNSDQVSDFNEYLF